MQTLILFSHFSGPQLYKNFIHMMKEQGGVWTGWYATKWKLITWISPSDFKNPHDLLNQRKYFNKFGIKACTTNYERF